MKKPNRLKMIKMSNNFIKKAKASYLKLMDRDARDGDIDLLEMTAKDLADTMYVCHEIKHGNYVEAYNHYYELDSDVQEKFPSTLIDMLINAEDWEYETNSEE
jgi:hypothetical protein